MDPGTEQHPGRATAVLVSGAVVALLCGLVFLRLAAGVWHGQLDQVDAQVLLWTERVRRPALTGFFDSVTALGSTVALAVVGAGVVVAMLIARRSGVAMALAVAMVGGHALSNALKVTFARARPEVATPLADFGGYSFPSGHVINAMVFFVTLALLAGGHVAGRGLRVFLVAYALLIGTLVALSRVYLGVHHPSDVLGGALVSIPWSIAVVVAEHLWRHSRRRTASPV